MTEILNEESTVKKIGKECTDAALDLQQILKGKEIYLARYCRVGLHMSMDAMTTSPVESMNNLIKHGPKSINSNMNLSRAVKTATSAIDERFDDHHNQAVREMGIINRASQAPTKRAIERKAQYMIDINFDRRTTVKCVQTAPETWLAWNFGAEVEKECRSGPWPRLARYHNVWKLKVNRRGDKLFLWCECQHHNE